MKNVITDYVQELVILTSGRSFSTEKAVELTHTTHDTPKGMGKQCVVYYSTIEHFSRDITSKSADTTQRRMWLKTSAGKHEMCVAWEWNNRVSLKLGSLQNYEELTLGGLSGWQTIPKFKDVRPRTNLVTPPACFLSVR